MELSHHKYDPGTITVFQGSVWLLPLLKAIPSVSQWRSRLWHRQEASRSILDVQYRLQRVVCYHLVASHRPQTGTCSTRPSGSELYTPSFNSITHFQPTSNRPLLFHWHLPTKCQSSKGKHVRRRWVALVCQQFTRLKTNWEILWFHQNEGNPRFISLKSAEWLIRKKRLQSA